MIFRYSRDWQLELKEILHAKLRENVDALKISEEVPNLPNEFLKALEKSISSHRLHIVNNPDLFQMIDLKAFYKINSRSIGCLIDSDRDQCNDFFQLERCGAYNV